jgi:hypothetical protein
MKSASISAILIASWIGPACFATADESGGVNRPRFVGSMLVCPDELLRRCCDIYSPKPLPCVPCFHPGCGACGYCSKPCPCISGFCGSRTAYCYRRKPCPDLCRPLDAHYFTCVKKCNGCADSGAFDSAVGLSLPAPQATQSSKYADGAVSTTSTPFLSD